MLVIGGIKVRAVNGSAIEVQSAPEDSEEPRGAASRVFGAGTARSGPYTVDARDSTRRLLDAERGHRVHAGRGSRSGRPTTSGLDAKCSAQNGAIRSATGAAPSAPSAA